MKKIKIGAYCICLSLLLGALTGCGTDEYEIEDSAIEELEKVNSDRAREETETENAERIKRSAEIAKAKAEAQEKSELLGTEIVMNGDVGEVSVSSSYRNAHIPAFIYFPENYDAEQTYPLVVMFAGFSADHDNGTRFNPIAEAMNKEGIMVVMYDNPGYGLSEETNLAYTFTNIKNDTIDVLMYMYGNYNIGKVGAFGYDVGGRVIMELQVEGRCNFDQIELIAPFCETDEFIHACFGDQNTWGKLKKEATDKGYATFGDQEYSVEWFEEWEDKARTLTADFVKNYKGRRCMLMYAINDDEVSYYTMADLLKGLGCGAIVSDEDGHDMGVRGWDSPKTTQRLVREQSADFMKGLIE